MRVGLALGCALGAVAACRGPRGGFDPIDQPELTSFAGYRAGIQGCVYGDCVHGAYARRTVDRVISGTAGRRTALVEWERGLCAGWTYRGEVAGDLPQGTGRLSAPDDGRSAVTWIDGRFARGELVGHADAEVRLSDEAPTRLSGELRVDRSSCLLRIESPEEATLAEITIRTPAGIVHGGFRGVLRIERGVIVPWRGAFLVDGAGPAGYVRRIEGGWEVVDRAVCLRGDCLDGDGVEHLGGGPFELYAGGFRGGLREGKGAVHVVDDDHVGEYAVTYGAGALSPDLALLRPRYRIHGVADGALVRLKTATLPVDGLSIGAPLEVTWDRDDGLINVTPHPIEPDARAAAGLPAQLDPSVAAVALLARELPRETGPRAACRAECSASTSVFAETVGPRTPAIVSGTDAWARVEPTAMTERIAIVEAWLSDRRQWLVGTHLVADRPNEEPSAFTGTANLIRADGTSTPVVYYLGIRIDPLGYKTVADYIAASPAGRRARAKRAATAAATVRARDARLGLALQQVTSGAGSALSLLDAARASIATPAADAPGYERVIRAGHAATERAEAAVFDAIAGADLAIDRLADADPCLDPLAALAAHLRDLDERLRIVLLAFDAFDYSDDADRLARIAAALAEDLTALETAPVDAYLTRLRGAVTGDPQPTPAPPPPAPASDDGATPPSGSPP